MKFEPRPHAHEAAPVAGGVALAAEIATAIPWIETERVLLRAPRVEDFGVYADLTLGERGAFFGEPQERDAAFRGFSVMVAAWVLHGHGLWTIEAKDGEALGFVLIGLEPGDREPELGFILTEAAEGRGLAFEAGVAACDFAWAKLGFDSLVSYIDPANARSRRLAERLGGLRDAAEEAALGGDTLVYRYRKGGAT